MVPLPFTGTKCQPHFDIPRTARIHTVPMLICCNISRCNRRTCRDLSVNFKQFSPATPKPSSIYIRPFPLSLIPIRYFSFCDTGFLIKIPDSQHLFRKYRNFSVKFQQMYSLFHGVLFLTIIFNLAWNVYKVKRLIHSTFFACHSRSDHCKLIYFSPFLSSSKYATLKTV